jgi:spore germination protein YaaH
MKGQASLLLILVLIAVACFTVVFQNSIVGYVRESPSISQHSTMEITPEPFDPSIISWIPYWDQQRAFESFKKNVDVFDHISLFWYRIDSSGNIRTYNKTVEDQEIIDFARENNVGVFALVANLPDYEEGGDWDWQRVGKAIGTPEARKKHILELLELVESKNFDGVNIDYEALHREQKDDFSVFIEELSDVFHKNGKLVGVAIHPKTSENNPKEDNGSQAQDFKRISNAADQLYLMTYDEHNELTDPGPIGSLEWMERIMQYAIWKVGVFKEKIFLGMPLYGYDWREDSSSDARGLEFDEVLNLSERHNQEMIWDEMTGESYFHYSRGDNKHIVWINDVKSISAKLKLAKKYRIGGLSFWRLGAEDQGVWEMVPKFKSEN